MSKVIVVGGGAAGLMAAVAAGENGAEVTLLEPNEKLGKKINITGKGRCNVTNEGDVNHLIENIPTNGRFLYSAFSKFDVYDTMNFFENEGVPLKVERGNRVFPVSDSAFDISDALKKAIKKYNVQVKRDACTELLVEEGAIVGCKGKNKEYLGDAVILATGGMSYPGTGSTGDGYQLAQQVGHTIMPLFGSLVPLEGESACERMQGLSLKNVNLTIFDEGKKIYEEFGEMLFTHFGVSGPIVLSASSHMHGCSFKNTFAEIDLKPALDEEKLEERILRDVQASPNKNIESLLHGLLPNSMVEVFLEKVSVDGATKANSLTKETRTAIVHYLKHFRIEILGLRPINEAIITSGGIKISEIQPGTMESKLVKGLYFAGEIIDVDAYTGGFNLQIAWSTGHLAGVSAANTF